MNVGTKLMKRSSDARLPVSEEPSISAMIAVVVFMKIPVAAAAGTSTETLIVQEVSGARLPPEYVRKVSPMVATRLPSQVPVESGVTTVRSGVPGSTPARSSMNAMLVAEKSRFRLLMVNSSVTVPPGGTGSSRNDLLKAISVTVTSSVALALPTGTGTSGARSMLSCPVTLSSMPLPVAVTSTVTMQLSPASNAGKPRLPLEKREMTLVPGVVVSVAGERGSSQSVKEALAGSAMTIPTGKMSVKLKSSASEPKAGLSIVNVRVLRPPRGTLDGEKLLENPGRSSSTVKLAVASPLLPALEVRSPDVLV